MAESDYNRKKNLEVNSVNDSGTTQDKAQPVLIQGETIIQEQDGFEDGGFTNNPSWTETSSNGSATVQSSIVINGSNALELQTSGGGNEILTHQRSTTTIDDGETYETFIYKDNVDERLEYSLSNESGVTGGANDEIAIRYGQNDPVELVSYDGTGSFIEFKKAATATNGAWYKARLKINPANSEAFLEVFDEFDNKLGDTKISTSGASNLEYVNLANGDATPETTNCYFDDVSFSATSSTTITDDSTTGTGDIIIDWTNIDTSSEAAAREDIALYDQDGNLLPYEIESLDTTAETGVIWVYNIWVRDDTVQAQVAYGNNSANIDRQTNNVFSNISENKLTYYFNDSSDPLNDFSGEGNSGTITGATLQNDGVFNGDINFDGADDFISVSDAPEFDAAGLDQTWKFWVEWEGANQGNEDSTLTAKFNSGSAGEWFIDIANPSSGTAGQVQVDIPFVEGAVVLSNSTIPSDGTPTQIIVTKTSSGTWTIYINGSQDAQSTTSNSMTNTDSNVTLGRIPEGNTTEPKYFVGDMDQVEFEFGRAWDSTLAQADYDASPKAGQVYFSQQAAEDTVTTQTVNASTTELTTSNPEPTVTGTGAASIAAEETGLTVTNPAPTITGTGAATVTAQETILTATNPEPAVNATGAATLSAATTELTISNPNPNIFRAGVIDAPVTNLTVNNPEPDVSGVGEVSVNADTTQLTISNPEPDITSPQNIFAPTTNLTYETPTPGVNATGAATLQAQTTELTLTTPSPGLSISDIQLNAPTKALITTPNKFALMDQKTFKVGDTGDSLTATLTDENGVIDLQGVGDVRLVMEGLNTSTTLDASVTVTDAQNGEIEYSWSSSGDPIDTEDVYRSEFKIETNGDPKTVPTEGYLSIKVSDDV